MQAQLLGGAGHVALGRIDRMSDIKLLKLFGGIRQCGVGWRHGVLAYLSCVDECQVV